MEKFAKFARIAEIEFSDLVLSTQDLNHKLRIYLKDKSFIDFFFTTAAKVIRFSLHWERQHLDKTIYRLDNIPDQKWKKVSSFPIHFHDKSYEKVTSAPFKIGKKLDLETIFRDFLKFIRKNFPPLHL
ncbi:hypothetical protein COY13_03430 [Candidatus Roizmanbacteria bacterium CG_4_10_14_0_2_um_filter_36_35]|uniref:Uncharacterized protein n=4 Tax=Candidatus Roizmaniibacteriota TaxID=1752723 RepID=A0A2M8F4H8_9BACT|nr:MAG: hypothetical protein COX47_04255 [Candidatus Roizmanbacteria bacterium CG23_combo_of_CG06-09_8_20_14_all_35_49]PIP62990.1 MAG: hypothetical protein COW98_01100 [Candidatus Roizmanbacteria bacterium CG22_combo_CG10-13_8_21_14_all_35_9]PIZ67331.1 MAG: hypothetical protein COY13_03430 [Candidatus Roizmanbacteria bacterium CG_4_10_14_0_2_um_filter_36_35]PJC34199.1 MAG: hypothetical protein CO048_00980 [Candidatus Roizmanbacteria bacterium CG_4_9_14_0_2_um_filter_35_15]PJC82699.1 MAG: hypoth